MSAWSLGIGLTASQDFRLAEEIYFILSRKESVSKQFAAVEAGVQKDES